MDTSRLDSDHKYVCSEEARSCKIVYIGEPLIDPSTQSSQSIQYSGSTKETSLDEKKRGIKMDEDKKG